MRRIVVASSLTGVLLVGALLCFVFRTSLSDLAEGFFYHPSQAVVSIESRTGMTNTGKRVFHATSPEVVGSEDFNRACPRQEVGSPIVGCYTPNDAIYIYDVTAPKLDGIKDVTAAHELLHAVWNRMSGVERDRIGEELEAVYGTLHDEKLSERMAYYDRTEKGQRLNELHSIIGTEVASLSPELEQHYARYFNRAKVLGLHSQYQSQYDTLEKRSNDLESQMKTLSDQIEADSKVYAAGVQTIEADIKVFNRKAQSGVFQTQSQFYSQRSVLMSRINALNNDRAAVNQKVVQYNTLLEEYNQVASRIQTLNTSLDSMKELDSPSAADSL